MSADFELFGIKVKDFISKHVDATRSNLRNALDRQRGSYRRTKNEKERLKERLLEFYRVHNPDKLTRVEELVAKHESKAHVLMKALHRKYLPQAVGEASNEARVRSDTKHSNAYVDMMQAAKMRVEFRVDETVRKLKMLDRAADSAKRRADIAHSRWSNFCVEVENIQHISQRVSNVRESLEAIRRNVDLLEGRVDDLDSRERAVALNDQRGVGDATKTSDSAELTARRRDENKSAPVVSASASPGDPRAFGEKPAETEANQNEKDKEEAKTREESAA